MEASDRAGVPVSDADIIISKKQLLKMVPYSGMHISRLESAGKFPRRLKLGLNRVGWLLSEIRAWIDARKRERPAEN